MPQTAEISGGIIIAGVVPRTATPISMSAITTVITKTSAKLERLISLRSDGLSVTLAPISPSS